MKRSKWFNWFRLMVVALILVFSGVNIQAAIEPPTGILQPIVEEEGDIVGANLLWDRDVFSQPANINMGTQYIYFHFSDAVNISGIKLYQTIQTNITFGIEYINEQGLWVSLPGCSNLSSNQMSSGWNKYFVDMTDWAREFRVRLYSPIVQSIGIGDIELWGKKMYGFPVSMEEFSVENPTILEFQGGSKSKGARNPQAVEIEITKPVQGLTKAELVYDIYDLEDYIEGSWEINGGGYHSLTPPGSKHSWNTAVEMINPDLLRKGINTISFQIGSKKKNGFKITNVRLRLYYDTGLRQIESISGTELNTELLPNIIDNDLSTYWESPWSTHDNVIIDLQLAQMVDVEYLTWQQECKFLDQVRIEYLSAQGWQLLQELSERQLQTGHNYIHLPEKVVTGQLRFTLFNPATKQMLGPISEIQVWGSPLQSVLDTPKVAVSYPCSGDVVANHTLIKGFVQGSYDQIQINDQVVNVNNNYFEIEMKLDKSTVFENFKRSIVVKAFRNGQIVAQITTDVFLQPIPLVSINSPENYFLTDSDQVTMVVETDRPSNDIYVNGEWFGTDLRTYQFQYTLTEGINKMDVSAVHQKELTGDDTIYVRKDTQSPLIHFDEDYNSKIMDQSVTVYPISGYIEDFSPVTLTVNGTTVELNDEYFSYLATLNAGYNNFTLLAVDELGHSSEIEVCLLQDSTAPEPFSPEADPAVWSQNTSPTIYFETVDLQSGMSHYQVSIDGGDFFRAVSPYTLPALEDGIHQIQIKAVDQIGLERIESVEVFVDTTIPEPFTPIAEPSDWSSIAQPIIYFQTDDLHSGIDYYEIRIDDGEYQKAISPYVLSELEDGSHIIWVKAVDRAGLEYSATTQVFVDTTAPEEFSIFTEPEGWSQITQPEVQFETTDIHSGISRYELQLDEGEFLEVESPCVLPALDDGAHQILIKAVDRVGLCTVEKTTIYVDTTKPENLVLTADPAIWSQNNRPTLTFSAEDQSSGIHYYELQIDDGSLQQVTSPYTLPELADGNHTVRVRAVDYVGLSIEKTVRVYVDTTLPESFSISANPADWSPNTEPIVTFETVDAHSGIDHYELQVDEGDYIIAESPYTLPKLSEGIHTIRIKAIDGVGLERIENVQVYIDKTPPDEFSPIAEPASWSQEEQPVIRFTTTDRISGVAYYELQINDESFYPVSSPYQLPVLEDGIHRITVKAIDQAGLFTIGQTEVFVDTTPPIPPVNMEINPGDGEIVVRWDPNSEWDIQEYRLYRQPEWSDRSYQVIEHAPELWYVDTEVTNGREYTYQLLGIDHVNNIGEKNKEITKEAGIAKEAISVDDGGDVEYGQEVEINIPPQSMEVEGVVQITRVQETEIPESKNPIVSKMYEFEVIDESGLKKEAKFTKDVTISIGYDETKIPDGYTEYDLDVYFYDELANTWVKMPQEDIDTNQNKVVASSNHFSGYSVQVTDNYSPAVDQYKDLGLSPYGSYFENNREYVSPSSGALSIQTKDFQLPGKNGFDFRMGRIYNSKSAFYDVWNEVDELRFGSGWCWDLPDMEKNNKGEFLYLQGSGIKCDWEVVEKDGGWRKLTYEHHEGIHFTAFKYQKNVLLSWVDTGYDIYFADGSRLVFNKNGTLKEMIDSTGENVIKFQYNDRDEQKVTDIYDTLDHHIEIEYNDEQIKAIVVDGSTFVTYNYSGDRLVSVTDQAGRLTEYKYKNYEFESGSEFNGTLTFNYIDSDIDDEEIQLSDSNIVKKNIPLMYQIIYPTGGISEYHYLISTGTKSDYIRYWDSGRFEGVYYTVTREGERTYYHSDSYVERNIQYLSEDLGKVIKPIDYEYTFEKKNEKPYQYTSQTKIGQNEQRLELDFDKDGMTQEKRTIYWSEVDPQKQLAIRRKYTYNDQKEIIEEQVYHENATIASYYQQYRYDNWGNKIYFYNSANGAEHFYYYLNTDSKPITHSQFLNHPTTQESVNSYIKNLLADDFMINEPEDGVYIPQQTHYCYDSKGNLIKIAKRDDSDWIEINYKYDNGNITKVTDALGNETFYEYDPIHQTFPVKKTVNPGVDADGRVQEDIVYRYGYDPLLGTKTWQIDPLGGLTEYGYDELGRKIYTIYPDDNDTYIEGSGPSGYSNRENNLVDLIVYEDIPNEKNQISASSAQVVLNGQSIQTATAKIREIVQNTGSRVIPGFDNGTIDIYSLTRYLYDGLNRWASLEQYLKEDELMEVGGVMQTSPFITQFSYDPAGNQTQVIDAEGKITLKEYDGLNRLTDIYYPDDIASPKQSEYHLHIDYDISENKRIITDAEGNVSEEIKDWVGNVTEVAKYNDNIRYSSRAFYDQLGNKTQLIDAKGLTYQWNYDIQNQLVEEKYPMTEVVLPNNSQTSIEPMLKYEYDKLGRKVTEIAPNGNLGTLNGHRTDYVYDNAGRINKVIANKYNENLIVKKYYDAAGREIKNIDPAGRVTQMIYSIQGLVLAEIDPMGRMTIHQYDALGREIAQTDPRGVSETINEDWDSIIIGDQTYYLDPAFTVTFEYDSLGRQIKSTDLMGNVQTITYDQVGNKVKEEFVAGPGEEAGAKRITRYTYTPQYWLKTVTKGEGELAYTVTYEYDKVGNKVKEILPDVFGKEVGSNSYIYTYDSFGQVITKKSPDGSIERYKYDPIGNMVELTNGRNYVTQYQYNGLGVLAQVIEANNAITTYLYDPNGNLVQKQLANGLITQYRYNGLNLLEEEVKIRAEDIMRYQMHYNKVGNVTAVADPLGNLTAYSYYEDGRINEEVYYKPIADEPNIPDLESVSTETVPTGFSKDDSFSYQYDQVGNLVNVDDSLGSLTYEYNRMNQITGEIRVIDDQSYTTSYGYSFTGQMTSITYPGSETAIEYKYNELDQLKRVGQYTNDFIYDPAGNLTQLSYTNGAVTTIIPDIIGRSEEIEVVIPDEIKPALILNYAYDANGNVTRRNNNNYIYDSLDRLESAEIDGTFLVDTPVDLDYVTEDYFVNSAMNYDDMAELSNFEVDFDYAASSIGIRFQGWKRVGIVELMPTDREDHRVKKASLRVYYRTAIGQEYIEVLPDDWDFYKDFDGRITIVFKDEIIASEIKIHGNYDDRSITTNEPENKAEFYNYLTEMVRVYGRHDRMKISYEYDQVGNRISETVQDLNGYSSVTYEYQYYGGSNRLMSRASQGTVGHSDIAESYHDGLVKVGPGEKMGYQYDRAGNMIAKGSHYNASGGRIQYIAKSGRDVQYWKYGYNARNRLNQVWKNGEETEHLIAEYWYDQNGQRIKVETSEKVTYYVYNYRGELLVEDVQYGETSDNVQDGLTNDSHPNELTYYIYALGRTIVKVEGMLGSGDEYYYHHDNLGSTVLMTDQAGQVVFKQDYTPFGKTLYVPGTLRTPEYEIDADKGFTGQLADVDTGLYYYNARYYDPTIGRFNREDEYQGDITRPQTLNLYVYVLNNPLRFVDPTGNTHIELGDEGVEVQLVQMFLGLPPTGIFDEQTLTAVNIFKEQMGLGNTGEWSGIVGDQTFDAMYRYYYGKEMISAETFARENGRIVNKDDSVYLEYWEKRYMMYFDALKELYYSYIPNNPNISSIPNGNNMLFHLLYITTLNSPPTPELKADSFYLDWEPHYTCGRITGGGPQGALLRLYYPGREVAVDVRLVGGELQAGIIDSSAQVSALTYMYKISGRGSVIETKKHYIFITSEFYAGGIGGGASIGKKWSLKASLGVGGGFGVEVVNKEDLLKQIFSQKIKKNVTIKSK